MVNRLPSESFLLVMVVVPALVVPLVFLTIAGVAAFRRRNGASIGPALSARLAFAGGASLGSLLLLFNTHVVALPIVGAAAAVAVGRWRAGRRVQVGWLLLGTGLPLSLVSAAVFLDAEQSDAIDLGDGLWFGAAAAAALVGIALGLRGDPRVPLGRLPGLIIRLVGELIDSPLWSDPEPSMPGSPAQPSHLPMKRDLCVP